LTDPRTLFEKVWDSHVVVDSDPTLLYVDLHLVHEVTSPQAFAGLNASGRKVRRPDLTVATVDHGIPTTGRSLGIRDPLSKKQIDALLQNCREHEITMFGLDDPRQGIVHVVGPEQGLTQPGLLIVCGDSHTSTHGAFGAIALGIGTSQVRDVLASQTLALDPLKVRRIRVDGTLAPGVYATDVILDVIRRLGVKGGVGHAYEYAGSALAAMTMDERMTICNMSIEGGARAGMIAPDETTFEYLKGREHSPKGADWDQAVAYWKTLPTDEGATYDKSIVLNAADLEPMITYGTNPGMGMKITERVPDPAKFSDANQKLALEKALAYMGLQPGQALLGQKVDVVFIGSCTNSRISDLRQAAEMLKGRKVAESTRVMVVPGSQEIKKQAEAEGLDKVFKDAGAEWREAGCSLCIAMNGDEVPAGQYCISTSNRNFEGRQGKGSRSFLASPLTAAATAINGSVTDPRTLFG